MVAHKSRYWWLVEGANPSISVNQCHTINIMTKQCTRNSHPLYFRWKSMRNRCSNVNNKDYKDYGGRGITVCERWNDFYAFVEDVGLPPTPTHQLDRINNDGDYTPDNVRWATPAEQCLNKRERKDCNPYSHWRRHHKKGGMSTLSHSWHSRRTNECD